MMIMRFFLIFFIKAYVVGTHLRLHRQVDAIQMSTHNLCLYKDVKKKYTDTVSEVYGIYGLCAYRGMCGN